MTYLLAEEDISVNVRESCDLCSARAMIVVLFPSGELTFCMHHYNNIAHALTDQGGVAKLLPVPKD
jgi:hypothetical protein